MKLSNRLAFLGVSVTLAVLAATGIGVAVANSGHSPATFGTIPEAAYDAQGGLDLDMVPDYVLTLNREGNPAGYVAKTELFAVVPNNNGQTVVDRNGRPIGRMVPGYGFVPAGQNIDSMTPDAVSVGPAPTG